MQYRYRLTNNLRKALQRCELLGHDNVERAAISVLNSDTWQHDWDLTEADAVDLETIRQWRQSVIDSNN